MENITDEEEIELGEGKRLRSMHASEYKALNLLAEGLHWFEVGLAALSVIFVALGVLFLFNELLHFRDTLEQTALTRVLKKFYLTYCCLSSASSSPLCLYVVHPKR